MYTHNCFLTLTYDEKNPEYHNNFDYTDIQKFKKRLRQHVWREKKQRIQIFNVHEYGKNQKKHWHLIAFNYHPANTKPFKRTPAGLLSTSGELDGLWPHGFHTIADVSEGTALYQAQYADKDFRNGNRSNHRQAHSKHSGLGRPWFLKNYNQILRLGYIPFETRKVPLPRYFEKLAHKHYCHYYQQSAFFDLTDRKALYRPFKKEQPSPEIAKLYIGYKQQKEKLVEEFEKQWNDILTTYIKTKEDPDFVKTGSNLLYDLNNKQKTGAF